MSDIKVSICCLAYNHEHFIRQCLDGFLMQKTNFAFEVLIHDDASTDATAEIISEYQEKYPTIVKPILQKENQYSKGVSGTFTHNFPRALGKYIAICEGDDYWIDPNKLSSQVDFLESNPEFGLVHTDYDMYYHESDEMINAINTSKNIDYTSVKNAFSQLLKKNHIATCTVLFKKDLLSTINFNEVRRYSHGDLVLWMEMSQQTKFKYLNSSTTVYRI